MNGLWSLPHLRSLAGLLVLAASLTAPASPASVRSLQAAAGPSAASAHVGAVRFIDHGLGVQPPRARAGKGWVSEPLLAAYRLFTLASQRAKLQFVDASVMYINQHTDLVLQDANLTIVKRGEVEGVDAPGTHRIIQTNSAVATTIGTRFDVRIENGTTGSAGYGTPTPKPFPYGTTTVSVVSGLVAVSGRTAYGSPLGRVLVHPGQWTHVVPGRAPTTPTTHNARQDTGWTGGMP